MSATPAGSRAPDLDSMVGLAADYPGWQVAAGRLGTFNAERVTGTARRFLVSRSVPTLRAKIAAVEDLEDMENGGG